MWGTLFWEKQCEKGERDDDGDCKENDAVAAAAAADDDDDDDDNDDDDTNDKFKAQQNMNNEAIHDKLIMQRFF